MTAAAQTRRPGRGRAVGPRRDTEIVSRLRKAAGQLTGVAGMVEDGRYCIDVLDQLSAAGAAVDAIALLVLSDHINTCVRAAIESGDTDERVDELTTAVSRYVRSR